MLQAGLLAQKCLSLLVFFSLLVLLLPAAEAQGPAYTNLLSDAGLSMWMKTDGSAVSGGWLLESDGVLHLKGDGGNIITREQYGDFDLWFEYRIASKGNSGIKY
ncbi:MAG: family 16 glycoside hydrolase, partial [Planctomyces sp.]